MSGPAVLVEFGQCLAGLGWVRDLWVAGSLATGDYLPGVSDLDLVAVVDGPINSDRRTALIGVHRRLDRGRGVGLELGCAYVSEAVLDDRSAAHPTWTHGRLVERSLSGIVRAELVGHGWAVFGRSPLELLPRMSPQDVREAARAELIGYWRWTARRPWMWLDPTLADLGLTSMARGRYTLATGKLLTKTDAVEQAGAPTWLRDQLRARRQGGEVASPRLRTAVHAWRDTRRTVALASAPGTSHLRGP